MREKIFRDPVHNFIPVEDELALFIINSQEFQRLRRIRQLGTSYVTYHGAEHSRFTHSLGAYHIMNRVLKRFTEIGIALSDQDKLVATIGALVHDLGHGPFSHVWEKVIGRGKKHEAWTREIIAGDTDVGKLLRERDHKLPERILEFLDGTYQVRFLSSLISSQLDVDRMDYLLRDSLLTGASYGKFDLERVIQVLAVDRDNVVVNYKGLLNVEEYLLARYFMYWQVYLHRTTRAQEVLLKSLLERARDLIGDKGADLVTAPAPLKPFFGGEPDLRAYLLVDDYDIFASIKGWSVGPDKVLSDLCHRFINRRLLKPVFDDHDDDIALERSEDVKAFLKARGWDPQYYFAIDRTSDVTYDYYLAEEHDERQKPAILVMTKEGQPREISKISDVIRGIAGRRKVRRNVYVPEDCREEARRIFKGK